MTVRHVLDRLPFWVAGDLEAPEAESIQSHLDQCPDCRIAAEGLREAQAWLRASLEPPFHPAEREALHQAILAQVQQEPLLRPAPRLLSRAALLGTAAAALVLVLIRPWHRNAGTPVASTTATAFQQAIPPAPSLPARAAPAPPRLARLRRPPDRSVEAAPGPTRIEFQTSDPTVRIIWLAQATPSLDTNPPLPEAP